MPSQDCVRGKQESNLLKDFTAQDLAFDGQPASVGIVEGNAFFPELLF
jgi:hypothetical protein